MGKKRESDLNIGHTVKKVEEDGTESVFQSLSYPTGLVFGDKWSQPRLEGTILGCPTLQRDSGSGRGEEWDLLHPGVKPEKNPTPSLLNCCNYD